MDVSLPALLRKPSSNQNRLTDMRVSQIPTTTFVKNYYNFLDLYSDSEGFKNLSSPILVAVLQLPRGKNGVGGVFEFVLLTTQ